MNLPRGIEGDYLETKEESFFFDIKGLLHPSDRKICFLRFIPDKFGDRAKNGKRYRKIYDLKERYEFLKKNYPQFLFNSKNLDLEVQSVEIDNIQKIYTPRDYYNSLLNKGLMTDYEKKAVQLCEILQKVGKFSKDNIGISGSPMIGLNKEISDIDLLIYGTKIGIELQPQLKRLYSTKADYRHYNQEELKTHYSWRFGGSNISFEDYLKSEQRKLHQGKYKDTDFFIRYLIDPSEWKGSFNDYQFTNLGHIKLIAKINEATYSIFTPCTYQISPLKLIEIENKQISNNFKDINEISSYRGRFCEQAKDGEIVYVEGKLERVQYKGSMNYRIMLTDQTVDKMIIVSS